MPASPPSCRRVSAARPKIADYPFTTLEPQLGVVKIDETDFVLADLPGLIEGAHEGVGLGDRFLGHAERCGAILHLIDGTGDAVAKTYKIIRAELEAYGHGLGEKPEIVALNKMRRHCPPTNWRKKAPRWKKPAASKVHLISGVSGEGINDGAARHGGSRSTSAAPNAPKKRHMRRPSRARPAPAPSASR